MAVIQGVSNQVVNAIIFGGDQFLFYGGGIFTGSTSFQYTGTQAAHAVAVTGLGSGLQSGTIFDCVDGGTNFIVIRNSWGTQWGENGYMRIKRTDRTNTYADADQLGKYGIWLVEMRKA